MNLYDGEVDFKSLAEQDSDFASVIQANNGHVDFQDPAIVKQLTISLLRKDFGLILELPDDRLCPPVPVRYSYVRWIQRLLANSSTGTTLIETILLSSTSTSSRSKCMVSGLDIGTGASCIYPLLHVASANSSHKNQYNHNSRSEEKIIKSIGERNSPCVDNINIIATDTDPYSLKWAKHNITLNSALISSSGSNIHAVLTKPSDPLLLPLINSTRSQNEVLGMEPGTGTEAETEIEADPLDFTMCNPPFYSSVEELEQSFADKDKSPAAVCTGSLSEMVYYDTMFTRTHAHTGITSPVDEPYTQDDGRAINSDGTAVIGGDAAFALRILEESSESAVRHRVRWYSCMLGKLSSLKIVIERLKALGVNNWAVCQLKSGNRTKRWAVAWSWGGARPSNSIARDGISNQLLLPTSNDCTICIDSKSNNVISPRSISMIINRKLKGLDMLHWSWDSENIHCHDPESTILNANNDFNRPEKSNNNNENDKGSLNIRGTGITQGNVWSRSARRRLLLNRNRCHSPSRGKPRGKDEKNEYSQMNSNSHSEPQKQHTHQPSLSSLTPDPRIGTQSKKRRREDHVSDNTSNREATTDADARTRTIKIDNDENNNGTDNDKQNTPKEKETAKSFNMASLFAFRICIHTENTCPSPLSSTSTSTSPPPPPSSATATAIPATAAATTTAISESKTTTTTKNIIRTDNNNNNNNGESKTPVAVVTIHWLYGHDRIVFESFCGMMRHTLQSACNS